MLDSLAGFFGGNQAAFIGGLHSLLQDAAGCWADLNCRLVRNKWIDALGLGHTFTVAQISGWRKGSVKDVRRWKIRYRRVWTPRGCDALHFLGLLREVKVREMSMERKIRLVYPARRALSHAAQAFLDVVGG